MGFIYFLGRFHVLLVHLPIGIIFAVVLLELMVRISERRYSFLEKAAPFLWGAAAVTSIVTVVLGYMHFAEGGFDSTSAQYHRIFGTLVAIIATGGWIFRSKFESVYKRIQLVTLVLLLATVTVAGHTGGNLTHGSTYLVEYAPQPVRSLAGLEPRRPAITDVAQADPYLDLVRPILRNRCSSCHGNDTRRNELSLYTYQEVMRGGKSGPAVVPGDLTKSELYRRITLPKDNKDFMPSENKPPMTDSEVKIIAWWIQSGAPTGVTLAKLKVSNDLKPLLSASLGLGVQGSAESAAATPVRLADPRVVGVISHAGFLVRQVSLDNPLLVVSYQGVGEMLSADIQALASVHDQIAELSLPRSGIRDQDLKTIGQLAKLERLHLEGNQISDSGVSALSGLKDLTYLNLFGNEKVTDASLKVLSELPGLKEVYLWNTGVTERAAAALHKREPKLIVDLGGSLETPSVGPIPSEGTVVTAGTPTSPNNNRGSQGTVASPPARAQDHKDQLAN